ncbi:Oxalate decarboxylase OxdD [Coccomyxa sp. Obi]|nr:Oxalate decarboxylase OxdD [Coccomyxa sp. Obi]
MEPIKFPGGTYKYSNIQNFPGSAKMSGTLITLYPGGLRELHWHTEIEWAIVLNGTCRATVVEAGTGISETWDYGVSDVWYFRSNEGHMVQGLANGCTYLAGYTSGEFDDLAAPSASSSLSIIPAEAFGQALGVSPAAVSASIAPNTNTFMPLGPVPNTTLEEFSRSLAGGSAAVPVLQTHRLQLNNLAKKVDTAGGWFKIVDSTNFPISTGFTGALVYFAPGGLRQYHWHTTVNEWQYVINGTIEAGVNTGPGQFERSWLGAGDAGYAPMQSTHYLRAIGDAGAWVVLQFDGSPLQTIHLPDFLSQVPKQIVATSLNTSLAFTNLINYKSPAMVPAVNSSTSKAQN